MEPAGTLLRERAKPTPRVPSHGRLRASRIVALAILVAPVLLGAWFVVEPLPHGGEPASNPDRLYPIGTLVSGSAPSRLPVAEPAVEASISRLFRAGLGREAQDVELDQWTSRYRDGEPLAKIADALVASPQFAGRYGATADPAYVERMYRDVLGRPADIGDVAYWTAELASGRSRGSVLVAMSESAEYVARTRTATPVPPRPLLAPPGVEHSVARLYLGLLGRWPERAEFDGAVARYLDGTSLTAIVDSLLVGPDLVDRYVRAGDEEFLTRLYSDVLGRGPEPAEVVPWRQRLDAGVSRASIVTGFTESSEMVARTRTAPPAPAPIRHALVAVGDSVMLGAVSRIEGIAGWTVHVDARGCRQPTTRGNGCDAIDIPSGVDALKTARQNGQLGGVVAIHVGNNGPMSDKQLDAMMAEVADQRLVLLLSLKEPRYYEEPNNAVIAGALARWPTARLVDWHTAASAHEEWFSDLQGIHLSHVGAQAMADMIAAALPA